MKNVIKRIASIAMAFTLLGTGTAVTKTISPKSNNTIIASAADTCHCKTGRKYGGELQKTINRKAGCSVGTLEIKVGNKKIAKEGVFCYADIWEPVYCANCGKLYAKKTKYSNVFIFIEASSGGVYVIQSGNTSKCIKL